jgi:hypothetical protein
VPDCVLDPQTLADLRPGIKRLIQNIGSGLASRFEVEVLRGNPAVTMFWRRHPAAGEVRFYPP